MTNQKINNWPQVYARIGGVLYLFNILAGLFGEVFVSKARQRLQMAMS
jgi:hypothetical protein